MNSYDINLNNIGCIKERQEFGYTEYVNICTNQTTRINWGFDIWLLMIFALIVIIFVVKFIIVDSNKYSIPIVRQK